MKTFEINWHHDIREYYTCEVEAETKEEALKLWEDFPYEFEYDQFDTMGLHITLESIEEINPSNNEE